MNEGEEALHIILKGTEVSLEMLLQAIKALGLVITQGYGKIKEHQVTGKQSVGNLVKMGGTIERIEIKQADVCAVLAQLKKYGVDFAAVKDKETGTCDLFFKAKDKVVFAVAFEKTLNKYLPKKEVEKNIANQLSDARIQKIHINAKNVTVKVVNKNIGKTR